MPASWLEITNRPDLGANLKAPQTDEKGQPYWSYSLINDIKPGDRILHYHKDDHAIVAVSRASGAVWSDSIVWGARGSTARERESKPRVRPGWYLALEDFSRLENAITLQTLRAKEGELRRVLDAGTETSSQYLPFAFSEKRPLRPSQGYLTRWPNSIDAVLGLPDVEPIPLGKSATQGAELGQAYSPADEFAAVATRDPFEVDPAVVERGVRAHATTQNALAVFLTNQGISPRSPAAGEPSYDLAWEFGDRLAIAEVKSITHDNAERQLRLGLGQVLRYRHLLARPGFTTRAVLVASERPRDDSWMSLCDHLGVVFVWPGQLAKLEHAGLAGPVAQL